MKTTEFKSIADRGPVQKKGIESVAQKQFLTKKDPALAKNMERFSSKTSVRPLRKKRK